MAQYTSQFKIQVAKESLKVKTYAEVAKKYGVDRSRVKEWSDAYSKYGDLAFEENGPQKFQEQRIRDLERQLAELQEENDILKKPRPSSPGETCNRTVQVHRRTF